MEKTTKWVQLTIDEVYRKTKWISGETDQKTIQNAYFHRTWAGD